MITKVTIHNIYGIREYYTISCATVDCLPLLSKNSDAHMKLFEHQLKLTTASYRLFRFNSLKHSQVVKYGMDFGEYLMATRHLQVIPRYQWLYELMDNYRKEPSSKIKTRLAALNDKQLDYSPVQDVLMWLEFHKD